MNLEIEKKYRLTPRDRDRIVASLADVGATSVGRDFEENTIFANDRLRDASAVVRIRKVSDRAVLTYKRRLLSESDLKKQIEYETVVADAAMAEAILMEIGLQPQLVYEKYRDTWQLRSVEVVIDELPFGLYMEIEGTIEGIREAEMLLGAGDLETENETYPRLTASLGKRVGEVTEARFAPERM
jgi:adenylate cyclase, class 2